MYSYHLDNVYDSSSSVYPVATLSWDNNCVLDLMTQIRLEHVL